MNTLNLSDTIDSEATKAAQYLVGGDGRFFLLEVVIPLSSRYHAIAYNMCCRFSMFQGKSAFVIIYFANFLEAISQKVVPEK